MDMAALLTLQTKSLSAFPKATQCPNTLYEYSQYFLQAAWHKIQAKYLYQSRKGPLLTGATNLII